MADRWYEAGYSGSANDGKKLKLHMYTIETSINSNKTKERCDLWLSVTNTIGSYWNGYGSPAGMDIGGYSTSANVAWDARTTGDKLLIGTWDIEVTHNDDGKRTIGVSAYHNTNTALGNATITDTYTCDTIPRQASIVSAPNFTDENNPTITYSNLAGNSVSLLQACISLTGAKDDIVYRDIPKTGTSYTFDLTETERNVLRNACTTSNSRTVIFFVRTIIGETTFYSTLNKTFSIVNANPIFENFDYEDVNADTIELTGNNKTIIKSYSNVKVTISAANKASAQKSASMKRYDVQIGNKKVSVGFSDTEDVACTIENADNITINTYAIDSRGNSTQKSKLVDTFIDYTPIVIANASIQRGDGGVGTETTLTFNGNIWNGSFGVVENNITSAKYQYRITGASEWIDGDTDIIPTLTENTFSFESKIAGDLGALGFDMSNSYEIRIIINDKLSTYTYPLSGSFILMSGKPAIAIGQKGTSFGAPYNEELGGVLQIEGEYSVLKEKVLYDNTSGSTGTLSLTQTSENFKRFKILGKYGTAYCTSVTVENPSGKYFNLIAGMMNQTVSRGYITSTNYQISGSAIIPQYFGEWTLNDGTFSSDNRFYIMKIIGYY